MFSGLQKRFRTKKRFRTFYEVRSSFFAFNFEWFTRRFRTKWRFSYQKAVSYFFTKYEVGTFLIIRTSSYYVVIWILVHVFVVYKSGFFSKKLLLCCHFFKKLCSNSVRILKLSTLFSTCPNKN